MSTAAASRTIVSVVCPNVLGSRLEVGVVTTAAGQVLCMHCCADAQSTNHRAVRQGER